MEQHGEDLPVTVHGDKILFRTRHAHNHRAHRFKVRRVRGQDDTEPASGASRECPGHPEVVLHVSRSLDGVQVHVTIELIKDVVEGLADDIGQDVQAAAVRHPHHRFNHALVRGELEDEIEHRDERLGPLERETLLSRVLGLKELLERLSRVEAVEDVLLVVLR